MAGKIEQCGLAPGGVTGQLHLRRQMNPGLRQKWIQRNGALQMLNRMAGIDLSKGKLVLGSIRSQNGGPDDCIGSGAPVKEIGLSVSNRLVTGECQNRNRRERQATHKRSGQAGPLAVPVLQ